MMNIVMIGSECCDPYSRSTPDHRHDCSGHGDQMIPVFQIVVELGRWG